MRVKVNKHRSFAVRVGLFGAAFMTFGLAGSVLLNSGLFGGYARAGVVGPCANCHTMHNSQNANETILVQAGVGAAWNAAGTAIVGAEHTPRGGLLVSDCLGCHSSAGANTKVTFGGDDYPIVFNTGGTYPAGASGAPNHPLAGGNFALNTFGTNIYGHNVFGIANQDTLLSTEAPGRGTAGDGCANSCHLTLALDDASSGTFNQDGVSHTWGGCKGCHTRLGHHKNQDPSYRYLGGHDGGMDYVYGDTLGNGLGSTYEDADWEQTKGAGDHNFYEKQYDTFYLTIGRFCAGCHGQFHAMGQGVDMIHNIDNGGDDNDLEGAPGFISRNSPTTSPWLRHPSSVNIPFDPQGEYLALNGAPYNPDIPVAQDPVAWGSRNTIEFGDQVMCLSCHRAHASDQPDALRFDYSQMIAHGTTVDQTGGCFFCHRTKDT